MDYVKVHLSSTISELQHQFRRSCCRWRSSTVFWLLLSYILYKYSGYTVSFLSALLMCTLWVLQHLLRRTSTQSLSCMTPSTLIERNYSRWWSALDNRLLYTYCQLRSFLALKGVAFLALPNYCKAFTVHFIIFSLGVFYERKQYQIGRSCPCGCFFNLTWPTSLYQTIIPAV